MLNIAGHGDSQGVKGAFAGYKYVPCGPDQISNLDESIGRDIDPSSPDWTHYARYWNGWTVLIKPLLVFLNFNQIRLVVLTVMTGLLVALATLLSNMVGMLCGAPMVLAFCLAAYPAACLSLSLSMSLMIGLSASILVVLRARACRASNTDLIGAYDWRSFFLLVGAVTVFLDFLCTPVVSLGLSLSMLLMLGADEVAGMSWGSAARFVFAACVSWAFGYGVLWVAKWVISSLVLPGADVIGNALGQAVMRSGDVVAEGTDGVGRVITPFDAISVNLGFMFPKWIMALLGSCLLMTALSVLFKQASLSASHIKAAVCLVFVAVLPYLWYLALSNHSYVHCWFTFRAQVVTLVASAFALCTVVKPRARVHKVEGVFDASK